MIDVFHYDNRDRQLGILQGLSDCFREFDVSKCVDTLTVQTASSVNKDDYLVIRGRRGEWLEYVVTGPSDDDKGEGATLVAELSMSHELAGHYVDDRRPTGGPAQLVATALEGTRWESLGSDIEADAVTQVWYHTNSLAALTRVASTFGGEIRYEYEVEGAKVTHRKVGVFKRVGSDEGRTFEHGRDLLGVARECNPDPIYTRVYGYGSGVEATDDSGQATGGYTRKITFAEVNDGKPYVESDEARLLFGIPDGHGGIAHYEGKVEFDDCKDPRELLRLTTEWAEAQYEPQWTYTVDVLALDGTPPGRGDSATVIDKEYDPPLVLKERVTQGHEDFLRPENDEYTLGKVLPMVSDTITEQQEATKDLQDRADGWDNTTETVNTAPKQWLDNLMQRLNQEFEAGGSYKFESFELGTIYSSVSLDEDGRPTRTPATAMQLTGKGFRISNKVDGSGNFVWRTFGTGDGITADEINTGRLQCGDNYLDLIQGVLHLNGQDCTVSGNNGSGTFDNYVESVAGDAVGDAMTEENIWNKLTNNGQTQGIYKQNGKIYINASYIGTGTLSANLVKAGILADSSGNVAINLSTGHATLKDVEASGSFTCGTTSNGMRLTSNGELAGYRSGSKVGSINYMGQIQRESGGTVYGLKVSGGTIGFDVDEIYTGAYRGTSGNAQYMVMRNAWLDGDGKLQVVTGTILVGFTNGICTHFDVW